MRITFLSIASAIPFCLACSVSLGQSEFPRTASGKPDFNGHYDVSSLTPFQRPTDFGDRLFLNDEEVQALRQREMSLREQDAAPSDPDREAPDAGGNIGSYNDFWFDRGNDGFAIDGQYRTSILTYPVNGRMPAMTPEGQARSAAAPKFAWPEREGAWWMDTGEQPYDGPENMTVGVRCIYQPSASIPIQPLVYNNIKQVVQTDDYVMIAIEWMNWARIIRIDDEHKPATMSKLDGDSIGWWEDDTLVVETIHFLEQPHEPKPGKRVIERFSPMADGNLLYSFTVEDPDYTDKYSGEYVWPRTDQVAYEYACHEGNYAMTATLRGARIREQEWRAAQAEANSQ